MGSAICANCAICAKARAAVGVQLCARPCAAKRERPDSLKRAWPMVASGMFRRTLIAALLASSPALAQPVAAPDCAVDGVLSDSDGLKLAVTYRCRASQPLSFQPVEDRAAQYVSDLKVEQRDGGAEAHYRFDLAGFARPLDSTSVAVFRGDSLLPTLGGWLLEPRGYDPVPVIRIPTTPGPGLIFAPA